MITQGSILANIERINGAARKLAAVDGCAELAKLLTEETQNLSGLQNAATAEIAKYAPIASLLIHPDANLTKIATWIGSFIEGFLRPYLQPYVNLVTELQTLNASIHTLQDAMAAATGRLSHCALPTPTLPQFPIPTTAALPPPPPPPS